MKRKRTPDFDASADMRLVELQRKSLGVAPRSRGSWQSAGAEPGAGTDLPAPALKSAVLVCDLAATPDAGLIPGAIATISLSLTNEGVKPAREVRVTVPLPGGASYRNGSFVRDGTPQLDDAADELFTVGTNAGDVAPKARVTFLWKIGVRMGNKPLVIAPHVQAEESAVIGAEPLVLERKEGAVAVLAPDAASVPSAQPEAPPPERPFYELEEDEILEPLENAPAAEYQPAIEPPAAPSIPLPSQPEPAPPPAQPEPVWEPGEPDAEPEMPPPPQQPPDVEPAAREAVVLYGRIDRPSLAYFERLFTGAKPPTLLQHFILGGALACSQTPDGADAANLGAHLDAQSQLLQRIVLHERLGKKEPLAEYAGELLAAPDALAPSAAVQPEPLRDRTALALFTEIDAPTLAIVRRMQEEPSRWDFNKARQMTLALQARSVAADAPAGRVDDANAALRAYAQTASMQLQRFFVRMRIDRTTALLFSQDEALDAAARTLIAALIALFEERS